jgi:hypothetical protein
MERCGPVINPFKVLVDISQCEFIIAHVIVMLCHFQHSVGDPMVTVDYVVFPDKVFYSGFSPVEVFFVFCEGICPCQRERGFAVVIYSAELVLF